MQKSRLLAAALSAAAISVVIAPTTASADIVSLATEIMMEDTASNNLILGSIAQPMSGSMLSYTTNMMSDGSYTYSTVAGSTINGKPVSLSGGGTEQTVGDVYEWTTYENGDYNGDTWTVTDYETATYDPTREIWIIHSTYYWGDDDLEIYVIANKDLTLDVDFGYFTYLGNRVPKTEFYSRSVYNDDTGDWDIDIWPKYPYPPRPPGEPDPIVVAGYTPGVGTGNFTATFVPEPSTWAMTALGFAVAGFAARRRARSRAIPT